MAMLNIDELDSYRHKHESSTEWKLRRAFLDAHHEKCDEERLVCLASCFVNVECYGCRYPGKVMEELSELATVIQDTLDEHRDMSRDVLKVKFVKESGSEDTEAAPPQKRGMGIAFVKASEDLDCTEQPSGDGNAPTDSCKSPQPGDLLSAFTKFSNDLSTISSSDSGVPGEPVKGDAPSMSDLHARASTASGRSDYVREPPRKKGKRDNTTIAPPRNLAGGCGSNDLAVLAQHVQTLRSLNKNAIEILHMAATKSHMNLTCDICTVPGGLFECKVLIDKNVIADGRATSKKQAKHVAYERSLENLQQNLSYKNTKSQRSTMRNRKGFNAPTGPKSAQSLSDFIIIRGAQDESTVENPSGIVRTSADFNHVTIDYDFREELTGGGGATGEAAVGCSCTLRLEHAVFHGTGDTTASAKTAASKAALDTLRETQWTIVSLARQDTGESRLSRDEVMGDLRKSSESIPASNIGSKLLQKMGWAGGGVGKHGTGIAVPVSVESVIDRQGLGLSAEKGISRNFAGQVRTVIMEYAKSDNPADYAFSPDFSNEERAIIHKESLKLGLKTKSHGTGGERYLVISRKRTPVQLLRHIMNSGGQTAKYKLIPPTSY